MILFPFLRKAVQISLAGVALSIVAVDESHAISGGPFSNGSSLPSGSNGTYTSTMLGNNLVGNMTFAVSNTSGSTGRYFVFHAGAFSNGTASGFVDPMTLIVTGAFGAGSISGGNAPTSNYATGGWTAFVVDQDTFQFQGSGTLSSSASNISATISSENASVQQATVTTTSPLPGDNPSTEVITEEQTAAAVAEDAFEVTAEQTPFFVFGYRSSTSTVSFVDAIVEGT